MKLGNRKKKRQQYLLDVKVQAQGRLHRRLRWMMTIAVAAMVFMLTCYGLYRFVKFAAGKLAFENPRFAVAQIVIEDDGGLTSQQVIQFAGVRVGQNLLSVDLDDVKRRLETIPLVRQVEVRRMLPQTLLIHIEERNAVDEQRLG